MTAESIFTQITAEEYLNQQQWFNHIGQDVYYVSSKGTNFHLLGASGDATEDKIHLIAGDNYGRDVITVDRYDDRKCIRYYPVNRTEAPAHHYKINWSVDRKTTKDGFVQWLFNADYSLPGDLVPTVYVRMDRKPYGAPQHEIVVEIRWSTGKGDVKNARDMIELLQWAEEAAEMLETRYNYLLTQHSWDKTFEPAPSTDEK